MDKSLFEWSSGFILLLILSSYSFSSAQAVEVVVLKNQIKHYPLGKNLVFLEDSQSQLTIQDIRDPGLKARWQRNKTDIPAFGFTSSAYWFAIELHNAKVSPDKQVLVLSYPLLDSVDVYLERDGEIIRHFHAGDHVVFAQRPIEHRDFLFPIKMLAKDNLTLYMRVQTTSSMQVPVALWNERAFWTADQSSAIVQGLYFGIILAMILYNLFIYSSVRDQSYLYYVCFVICFAVMQLNFHGFSYRHFWPQHPWFNAKILIISASATLSFGGLFTTSFLDLKKRSPPFYRLLIFGSVFSAFNIIISLIVNYMTAIGITLTISLVMSAVSLAAGSLMWRRGYLPARYYTIAWMGFLLGTIAFVLNKCGVIPRNLMTENGIQIGSAIEVILLSFALANRINVISREKELAQSETVSILKKYQALYENAIEGIFQTTLDLKLISANQATMQMLGLSKTESLCANGDNSLLDFFANQTEADEFHQLLLNKRAVNGYEFRAQRRAGDDFWASISARPVFADNGNLSHYEGSIIDVSEKREAQDQIRYMAYYDNVTGLPNRALLQDLLKHALDRAKRNDDCVAVLFVDLNRFKLVNDTLGHDAGDTLLQEVGERLHHCLRGSDWVARAPTAQVGIEQEKDCVNTVARLGGDEFVMVITDIHHAEDAAFVARRVGKALEQSFTIDSREVYISASIGISIYPIDSDDPLTLLKQADAAMYHIKKQSINHYQFYAEFLTAHASKKLALETELRHALINNEFELFYQPKLDLKSGQIVGVEVLCRWQHPKRGLILPKEFIGLAEEIGLIVPLGEWVLRTACEQNKSWQDAGLTPIIISVNLSVRQFNEPALSNTVSQVLESTGLEPSYLELELTENLLMGDTQVTSQALDKLKAMGLYLSIDDFGTGYSSLGYLKRLPVDVLKIDRCFIQDIIDDTDNQAITAAIISMAKQLRLKVIAEGVETEDQLHYLREHRCDEIQGNLVSVALSVEQFTDLLQKNDASELLLPVQLLDQI